jgi:hypothetical protein
MGGDTSFEMEVDVKPRAIFGNDKGGDDEGGENEGSDKEGDVGVVDGSADVEDGSAENPAGHGEDVTKGGAATDQLDWVICIPGLFHLKMAAATDAFQRIHVKPEAAGRDDAAACA